MANKTAYREADYDFAPDSDVSSMISSAIANKKKMQKSKKRGKGIAVIAVVCTVLVISIAGVYFGGWISSMGKFLKNTYINNIDVSGMTLSQAVDAVKSGPTSEYLVVTGRSGSVEHIPLDFFDYKYDLTKDIKEVFDQVDHANWYKSYFKQTDYTTNPEVKYDYQKLEYILRNTVWGKIDTSDAKMVYDDDGYYVQPEIYGDTVDIEELVDYVMGEVEKGNLNVNLSKSRCYTDPTVFAEDLEQLVDDMNAHFNFVITIDFDYTQETLSGSDVYDWAEIENGSFTLDHSKVESYVAALAQKYDTFMTTRTFRTTNRGVIQLSQGRYSTGQYGWWIDQEKTVEKLIDCIEAGENVTIDPEYVQLDTGYCYVGFPSDRSAGDDIGNTYIEIDLSAQHLWYYREGELLFETDQIVSGKATDSKRKTPEGIYSVYIKQTNYTMKTPEYTAKCSYFMRLSFEGIGLHDLSRSVYGGDTYINNGSHGCINMRYNEVSQLYDLVEKGTPAVLYY